MKKKRKFNWQRLCGLILICFGLYLFVNGIGFKDISELAMGIGMGEGSVFVIWGMRELFGSSINKNNGKPI